MTPYEELRRREAYERAQARRAARRSSPRRRQGRLRRLTHEDRVAKAARNARRGRTPR